MRFFIKILLLLIILGCSREGAPEVPLKIYLSQGLWSVNSYGLNNENITDQFESVTLKFSKNGKVLFTKNNNSVNGNWNYRYESVPNTWYSVFYFSISFASNDIAMLLNQEWDTSLVTSEAVSGSNSDSAISLIKLE